MGVLNFSCPSMAAKGDIIKRLYPKPFRGNTHSASRIRLTSHSHFGTETWTRMRYSLGTVIDIGAEKKKPK